jgi:hypothetical protein
MRACGTGVKTVLWFSTISFWKDLIAICPVDLSILTHVPPCAPRACVPFVAGRALSGRTATPGADGPSGTRRRRQSAVPATSEAVTSPRRPKRPPATPPPRFLRRHQPDQHLRACLRPAWRLLPPQPSPLPSQLPPSLLDLRMQRSSLKRSARGPKRQSRASMCGICGKQA